MSEPIAAVSPVSAAAAAPALSVPRPGGLDAALAKCQSQLADWTHCVSASTPEGKAKIEALDTQIAAIKHAMKQADGASKPGPSALGNLLDISV